MDVYKLKNTQIKKINKHDFEENTKRMPPYYPDKLSENPFAICPACNNPIQIIGFSNKINYIKKPYAKHVPNSIVGLPTYCQEAYEFCPLSSKSQRKPSHLSRKKNIEGLPLEILKTVRDNFDKVIFFIEKEIDIYISTQLAESMLENYLAHGGYLYSGASLINIPWIFLYEAWSKKLFGRCLVKNCELQKVLQEKISGIVFDEEKNQLSIKGKKAFLNLYFGVLHHEIKDINNETVESLRFIVTKQNYPEFDDPKPDVADSDIIFEKKLIFNYLAFQNYLKLPHSQKAKVQQFLDIAKKHIDALDLPIN